jgi:hypothetical protein
MATVVASIATSTPTTQELPTAIPTPGVGEIDPNYPQAGPRPDETATGHDSKTGEWTRPDPFEANVTDYYKNVIDPKRGEAIAKGWFKDIVVAPTYQGGIPLFNQPDSFPEFMAVHVWCEAGLQCPSLQHLRSETKNDTELTFNRELITILNDRFKEKYSPHVAGTPYFSEDLFKSNISIPFTTAQGNKYEYKVTPNTNIYIYVVKEMINPDVTMQYVPGKYVKTITSGDEHGNLNVATLFPNSESLSYEDYVYTLFMSPFCVFSYEDQSQSSVDNHFGKPAGKIFELLYRGNNPYLLIQP